MRSGATLTELAIKKAKAPPAGQRLTLWDNLLPGFGVRITDKGSRSFIVQRRIGKNGPMKRLTIGEVKLQKEDGGFSLAAAREVARGWIGQMKAGVDPKAAELEAGQAAERERKDTFRYAWEQYERLRVAKQRERTQAETRRPFEKHFLPAWGERPLSSVTRRECFELIYAIAGDGRPIAANRALANLSAFFGWAVGAGFVDTSPVMRMEAPGEETDRRRVLAETELRWFWQASGELGWPFGDYHRFLLLSAQRRSEVAGARWPEIDLDGAIWIIPAERAKGKRAHLVPLSPPALTLLRQVPRFKDSDFVFTLRGAAPVSGFSRVKRRLDKLMTALAVDAGEREPIADWHLHDLRRTAGTALQALGFGEEIRAAVLGHSRKREQGVTAVYSVHEFKDEKTRALTAWANRLHAILNPKAIDNVVSLPARRPADSRE